MWLIGFVLTAGLALLPLVAQAQAPGKTPRIEVLEGSSANDHRACVQFLRRGLNELGYMEGRTVMLEVRWAEGRSDVFPNLAASSSS